MKISTTAISYQIQMALLSHDHYRTNVGERKLYSLMIIYRIQLSERKLFLFHYANINHLHSVPATMNITHLLFILSVVLMVL